MKEFFFKNCKTKEEAKKRWRDLALLFHPDRGGDTAKMQEINSQYKDFLRNFEKEHGNYADEKFNETVINNQFYDDLLEMTVEILFNKITGDKSKPINLFIALFTPNNEGMTTIAIKKIKKSPLWKKIISDPSLNTEEFQNQIRELIQTI